MSNLPKWAAPALLVVTACVQILLARTVDLTAWKGGGFGMFSTLDHGAYRRIEVVVEAADRSEEIEIAPSLETAVARAAAYPSNWLLKQLADGIVAREQRYDRPVTRVTMNVWATTFDRATLRAEERPLRTFVYDVP